MLQLRTTAVSARNRALRTFNPSTFLNARVCVRLEVPCQQQLKSKVASQGSLARSLALQAQRGDDITPAVVATETHKAGKVLAEVLLFLVCFALITSAVATVSDTVATAAAPRIVHKVDAVMSRTV